MKFKIGDKVRVVRKSDTNCLGWSTDMNDVLGDGKTYTITGFSHRDNVYLAETTWVFNPESLELVPVVSLPINLTFKNKYEHQAMRQFLFDNGCKWYINGYPEVETGYIGINEDKKMFDSESNKVNFKSYPTFTFNDLETIKEILNPSKPITEFKLNNDYTATIDPNTNTVKVGCQSFTFDKIKELASKL